MLKFLSNNARDQEIEKNKDYRNVVLIQVIIIISGLVATLGYNYIPFKAYIIVAALVGLISAIILTKMIKNNE